MAHGVKVVLNEAERTAQVTIYNETRTLKATPMQNGEWYLIPGIAVRYRTGSKVWHGRLYFWPKSGNVQVQGGMENIRSHRGVTLVGFYDADNTSNSQHNSQGVR